MADYKRVFIDGHSYFLTVVTHRRNPILIENVDLLRESIREAKSKFVFDIEAIVILPDHFHMLIKPKEAEAYPKIIGSIKRHFSRHCDPKHYEHLSQSNSREEQGYRPVWQKRFYEHTIRDEDDFRTRIEYIHYNPVKHGLVTSAKEWENSSFHKYVRMGRYDEYWGGLDGEVDFE